MELLEEAIQEIILPDPTRILLDPAEVLIPTSIVVLQEATTELTVRVLLLKEDLRQLLQGVLLQQEAPEQQPAAQVVQAPEVLVLEGEDNLIFI